MGISSISMDHVDLNLDNPVLSNLNCEFTPGITCLLGPNGSGKTMTNRLLALIQPVTSGSISWDGAEVNPFNGRKTELLKEIGYMRQQPIFVNKSVEENIELPLKFRNDPDSKSKLAGTLEEFELTEFAKRPIAKLSVGQQQRVALARTLITDPQLLILDEPTSSLDMKSTKWIESYLLRLRNQTDKIILWTTHDHFQVKRVADHVAVILEGSIRAKDTLDAIFTKTEDPSVRKYLEGELI